ncbi:hypothetical protein Ahy_B09g096796 isoform B [Arachis hypogaea]|uniref:Uncharacterized protein n=1 Tax=Arachis hypogaea TaxID=3818 RepID=A0A444XMB1_ARAHY|nr:hypothetical protein Ahy_B09g096796 isoform B [Arachis hypogaea]
MLYGYRLIILLLLLFSLSIYAVREILLLEGVLLRRVEIENEKRLLRRASQQAQVF